MSSRTITILATLITVSMITIRWWYVVGIPSLLMGVSAVVLFIGLVWLAVTILAHIINSTTRAGIIISGLATAASAVSWVGRTPTDSASIYLLIVGLSVALIFLVIMLYNTTLWKSWLDGLTGAAILVIGLALLGAMHPWGSLVWNSADQLLIAGMTRSLLAFNFDLFHFQFGLSVWLAPFIMIANLWEIQDAPLLANLLNHMVLPTHILIVLPLTIGLMVRAVTDRFHVWWGVVLGLGLLVYRLFPPEFVPDRHDMLVPRGLYGIIFSPEIIGLFFVAIAIWVLSRLSWNWLLVGAVVGITIWTSERHLLLALPLLALLFTIPNQRINALRTSIVAGVLMIPQLLYFRVFYGGWLFPNRDYIWERHADRWVGVVEDRYGLISNGPPERVDIAYLSTNLPQILAGNWWWLSLAIIGLIVVFYINSERWRLWVFCAGVIASHIALSAVYINIIVSWRYNFVAASLSLVIFIAALSALIQWRLRITKNTPD